MNRPAMIVSDPTFLTSKKKFIVVLLYFDISNAREKLSLKRF